MALNVSLDAKAAFPHNENKKPKKQNSEMAQNRLQLARIEKQFPAF